MISIHALREEGDKRQWKKSSSRFDFYPRPPRGGRPAGAVLPRAFQAISIHALREEGDKVRFCRNTAEAISIHALREEGDPAAGRASTA